MLAGTKVKVHGAVFSVLSVHRKGKKLKVTDGTKVLFKSAKDCVAVAA